MRMLITWILFCFSIGIINTAGGKVHDGLRVQQSVPYIQQQIQQRFIPKKDHEDCAARARIGAGAFHNARLNIPIERMLKEWDGWSFSREAENFEVGEILLMREIIIYGYKISKKFPNATEIDFGEFIYFSCLKKRLILVSNQ